MGHVCRWWNALIRDESCWRSALFRYFGALPLKRISKSSWKTEYLVRSKLIRDWTFGKCKTLQYDPKIGPIHEISHEYEGNRLFAGNLDRGMVVSSNPSTGRIEKDAIFCDESHEMNPVAALKIDK